MTTTLAGLLMALTLNVWAQQAAIPPGDAAISGRAIDLNTERPLQGVLITLTSAIDVKKTLVAETDKAGLYAFDGIAAGEYRLTAKHPEYVSQTLGVSQPGPSGMIGEGIIRLGPRQHRSGIDFALARGGTVSGRITSHDGQPLRDANVILLVVSPLGNQTMGSGGMGRTNADGRYDITNVPEGTYVVTAQWIDRELARTGAALTEYRPTYFPGTERRSEATPVKIAPGETHRNIDFSPVPSELHLVRGHVLLGNSEGRTQAYLLSSGNAVRTVNISDDGAFSVQLKPGLYMLVARADGENGGDAASMTLDVRSEMNGLLLGLNPTGMIAGRIVTADGSAAPEGLYLAAILAKDGTEIDPLPRDRVEVMAGGAFVFPGMFGERIVRTGLGDAWVVDRILVGKTAVTSLTVQPGQHIDDVVIVLTHR